MNKPDKDFTDAIVDWYEQNRRELPWRKDCEPYHIWVSEIMLQQTRVEAVREYYKRFMKTLPTVRDLASASEDELLKLWEGLGYYNRVKNMKKAAIVIEENYGGRFPVSFSAIKELPGIGDYTAGAIASIAFDEPTPAVDGNVLRVMSRILEDGDDVKSQAMKKRLTAYLSNLYPAMKCGAFTQGLIELGALICVPKGAPRCDVCPIHDFCRAFAHGTITDYPVKVMKKLRPVKDYTCFILSCGDCLAVEKRPAEGLLGGLYQFPNVEGHLTEDEALAQVASWGCSPAGLNQKRQRKHIFSHVTWDMTGYYITCEVPSPCFTWANADALVERIPLPTAFGQFYGK